MQEWSWLTIEAHLNICPINSTILLKNLRSNEEDKSLSREIRNLTVAIRAQNHLSPLRKGTGVENLNKASLSFLVIWIHELPIHAHPPKHRNFPL